MWESFETVMLIYIAGVVCVAIGVWELFWWLVS